MAVTSPQGKPILGSEGQVVQACQFCLANEGARAPRVLRPWPLRRYPVLEGESIWGWAKMNGGACLR
jgi:hypothetical protein